MLCPFMGVGALWGAQRHIWVHGQLCSVLPLKNPSQVEDPKSVSFSVHSPRSQDPSGKRRLQLREKPGTWLMALSPDAFLGKPYLAVSPDVCAAHAGLPRVGSGNMMYVLKVPSSLSASHWPHVLFLPHLDSVVPSSCGHRGYGTILTLSSRPHITDMDTVLPKTLWVTPQSQSSASQAQVHFCPRRSGHHPDKVTK